MITKVVVWWQFFLLKKWTKVGANFFFWILNFLILVLVQRPTTSKNSQFHGEQMRIVDLVMGDPGSEY
jgi:hypothetical protein